MGLFRLPAGKISTTLLTDLVFTRTGAHRQEIVLSPGIGEDSAVLDFGGEMVVASTDPITAASRRQGWLAIKVAVNDVAAKGAEPVAVLVTILLPQGSTEDDLGRLTEEIHRSCEEEGVAVAGGHTEVTPGLLQPVLVVTALGKTSGRLLLRSSGARPGDDVVMTKWAGLEGTAVLLSDYPDKLAAMLRDTQFSKDNLVELGNRFFEMMSVTRDGKIAAENGATASHDATEGGILGAVFELCEASDCGVVLRADAIPVLDATVQVALATGIDPLKLTSSGCLVVTHPEGERLVDAYRSHGIPAAVIGEIIPRGERVVIRGARREVIEPPGTDHLWLARERLAQD